MSNLHPFELSGCGVGPFRFITMVSIPSATMAEKNPEGYNNALRALPVLDGGCGTCRHCGMAIMNICVIQDSNGKRFGVGTTCVEQTEDASLGNPVKIALARHNRQLRAARLEAQRVARRQAWEASPAGIEWKQANEQRAALEAQARKDVRAKWEFMLPHLDAPGFRDSIATSIRNGFPPTGRAVEILRDIFAKNHGRRGSAAYEAAESDFDSKIL